VRTEIILKYYWDLFLSHTCEFYPLTDTFIAQYEYELNWNAISKSRVIQWDIDFLEKYEHRFTWHELAWNEAIIWDIEKIEKFKKRLDWYYLGRNKALPISEDMISKYSKKMIVMKGNPRLTQDMIDKYSLTTVPEVVFDPQSIKEYNDEDFDKIFNSTKFYHNQKVVYDKVFRPIIDAISLEKIFGDKFDYSQCYYFLGPLEHDIHGLTPEFVIKDPKVYRDNKDHKEPFVMDALPTLINGSLQEGPARLYDIPRSTPFSGCVSLLVSENVRNVLEQFRLPEHNYQEVRMEPKKIKTETKFYVLQITADTLNKDLIYEGNAFHYSLDDYENRDHGPVTATINNGDDVEALRNKLREEHLPIRFGVKIIPEYYRLDSSYDLYTFSVHKKIIINQYLKDALEKNFPGQIGFRSAQLLNIHIDQSKYDDKKQLLVNTKLSSKLSVKGSEEDKYYFAKRERLENFDTPFDVPSSGTDTFTKKEIALNVIFPEVFRNNYSGKRLKISGYKLLPVSGFYIQDEYSDRHPETYKSVVIAENGIGDSINLLLEKDSDHKLQNRLFQFFHESGEYREI
jgi:hypothetical protein